jgi:hypothetical protein
MIEIAEAVAVPKFQLRTCAGSKPESSQRRSQQLAANS